ncbi:hypothetical protein PROFUN_13426 [Planoprotostelium fungivorum]|uniref:tRNA pseudouridine(55) synthase n=1 Tax=Planoprotostelium fungivorum TaxID=1890364 RepID=A0A2P6N411_9EUKA|nr:hypothetical protein PROFUN_13426 [Planoprotostelium fungivorum]
MSDEVASQLTADIQVSPNYKYLPSILDVLSPTCCARCILRFTGVQAPHIYSKTEMITEPERKQLREGPLPGICSACLGLLEETMIGSARDPIQHRYEGKINEMLSQELTQTEAQFDDYTLAISLPPSLIIRQYSIWYLLRQRTQGFNGDVPIIVEIKECLKWTLGRFLQDHRKMEFKFQSNFTVTLIVKNESTNTEHEFLADMKEKEGLQKPKPQRLNKRRANGDNKKVMPEVSSNYVSKLLDDITFEKFKESSPIPPPPVTSECSLAVSLSHSPIYVAGRYIKYSRDISQSPWVIDGVRKTQFSVEEILAGPILPMFKAQGYKFMSAGREDSDVRMTGRGRPFVLEIENPKVTRVGDDVFRKIEHLHNSGAHSVESTLVKFVDLQIVPKGEVSKIKEGEQTKTKNYRALVWISRSMTDEELRAITERKDLVIDQKTPVRVLHRRTLAVRQKKIHSLGFERINEHFIYLDLHTESGTYIKEFVHGDLGRTQPSFTSLLGCQTDILELDVTSVNLDFPSQVSTEIPETTKAEIPHYLK